MANSAHYKPWKKPWKRKQSSPDIAIYISPNIVLSPDKVRALDAITICEDVYLNKVKATRNIPNSIDWVFSLLLDSREIKADNINHYLSSIIDELLRFWKEDSYLQTVSLRKSALAPT
ncbi:592_t:CDS:2 [Rhizophagus irregularis]|nr:592_t:CDS:2 [Rhizophagus irregularis]